ncbi:MAG TPA: F0F1 ATP synthase subunit B [Gemmatimonadaceae bacterium]|nr:F0F1 ATP synthase subunit B [Gemmatimonadaceae bacterium]
MRASLAAASTILLAPAALVAQEHAAKPEGGLLDPHGGLMIWTLLIFVGLFFILSKFAFGPITEAVEAREQALQDALDRAKKDREEAARLLAEHTTQLEGARAEAQRIIAEGRAVGEKLRSEMVEETRAQQQDMLERARRELATERDNAIAQLRAEAVELAIAGASKVIEKNLDDQTNRKLVEGYLASAPTRRN